MKQLFLYSLKNENMENSNFIAKKVFTNLLISVAAEGIFNALDADMQKKYSKDSISDLIKKTDKDKDGIITEEEAKKDINNIFGLHLSGDTDKLEKIQASVNKSMELRYIKGLEMGLDNWSVAKNITIEKTSAQDLRNMFSDKNNVDYYCKKLGKNSAKNKALVELFKAREISVEEIKTMSFSEDVLNDILRYYDEK